MNMFKLIAKPKTVSEALLQMRAAKFLLWSAGFLVFASIFVGWPTFLTFLVAALMGVAASRWMSQDARDFLERH